MRVLLLGATGFIGSAVLRRLLASGHAVTALGRNLDAARRRWPEAAWREGDLAVLTDPAAWQPHLVGIEAVINCAGALQDGARDDVAAVQSAAPRALFAACAAQGIGRIVQVSAVGAAPDAPTTFMRSKAEAEAALMTTPGEWVILRPGLVLGPQAYGGTALLRALAALPFAIPLARGEAPMQTVFLDDVAAAVLDALEGRLLPRTVFELVEAEPHSLESVLLALRAWLGLREVPVRPVSDRLSQPALFLGDMLGWLGWRSPLRSTAWSVLARGVTGDPRVWDAVTGRPVRPLAETLRAMPATVQERWFARLWPVKPLAIATLAAFWIASGAIGLLRLDDAAGVLTTRGAAPALAGFAVVAGATVDLALGAAILVRRWMRRAAQGMLVVTSGYLLGATVLAPDLWLDPLGPLVKTIPAAVLALVALATAEER